jgi:3-hydroxybutyryl-CoA dehydrogenase
MVEKSRLSIEKSLQGLVVKGKLTQAEKDAALGLLTFTNDITHCIADVIIEAIIESKEAKVSLFNQVAAINSSKTIFATNTSSISITEIASQVDNPARVIGMHFFNPAPIMKLVEIVMGDQTSTETRDNIQSLSSQFGKTPVLCKDAPGFIVNRVARHYYLQAMKLVEEGVANVETIDQLLEATGFKMGPFKLMDLIGMDINYGVSNIVWEALDRPERLQPSKLQKQKVEAGELGKKTGKGFYSYN